MHERELLVLETPLDPVVEPRGVEWGAWQRKLLLVYRDDGGPLGAEPAIVAALSVQELEGRVRRALGDEIEATSRAGRAILPALPISPWYTANLRAEVDDYLGSRRVEKNGLWRVARKALA